MRFPEFVILFALVLVQNGQHLRSRGLFDGFELRVRLLTQLPEIISGLVNDLLNVGLLVVLELALDNWPYAQNSVWRS